MRADYAIFADPGAESIQTYRYLVYLQAWQKANNGIKIIIEKSKNIYDDIMTKANTKQHFASIPAYTLNEDGTKGMLRRQCTYEYKIIQVNKAIRKIYGLLPRARTPKTEIWIGITIDEVQRAKDNVNNWATNIYPFLNYPYDFFEKTWNRFDCISFFIKHNLEIPPKSSCIFCPYQSPDRWKKVMENETEKQQVINIDKAIRNMSMKGMRNPIFLTKHCLPIDEVNFKNIPDDLFLNECEGHCGL
jgi:hypothetical protein